MIAAIILAAGRGERMGAKFDKAFLSLGPKPMVAYSLLAFEACADVEGLVLVVRRDRIEAAREMCKMFGVSKLLKIVSGGSRRQDSVRAGLAALPPETTIVTVHDSARPLVTPALISATIASARKSGSGVAAHKVVDTIKECGRTGIVSKTIDRAKLWAVETPQSFRFDILRDAYDQVAAAKKTVTDDAGALEFIGRPVQVVEWQEPNLKITYPGDLAVAAALLKV